MAETYGKRFYYDDDYRVRTSWKGWGWDTIPVDWIIFQENEFTGQTAKLNGLRLRILAVIGYNKAYVVQENWRWRFWWIVLRIWLAACWIENNLRMTAAIWGILQIPEAGAMPLWSSFVILRLLRGRKVA